MSLVTSPSFESARPKGMVGLVVSLTLLGLGLRLFHLSNQALWTDELSSISTARAPLSQIYEESTQMNNSLPTYFLLLRVCLGQVTTGLEFRARFPSAVAGALSIPVLIAVVWLWRRSWRTALVAGALLAVNPLHIWYSQEVRAYAVMLFFGLLSVLGFELARSHAKRMTWGLYWGAGLGAMALHKTGLVFPVACMLWDGWKALLQNDHGAQGTTQPLRSVWDVLRPGTGVIRWHSMLLHAPLLMGIVAVLAVRAYPPGEGYRRASSILEVPYTFLTFLGGYSFGPSISEIQSAGAWQAISQNRFQLLAAAVALGIAGLACMRYRGLVGPELLLLGLGIGMVVVYGLISGFPYNVRYTLPALLGFLALIAAAATGSEAASSSPRQEERSGSPISVGRFNAALSARWTVVVVVAVAIWADSQWFFISAYRKSDARAVARWLTDNRDRIRSWTVLPGYLSKCVEWYLASEPEVLSGNQRSEQDQTTRFPPVPDALILGRRHHILKPDQLIGDYRSLVGAVETNRSFAGFEVYVRRLNLRP